MTDARVMVLHDLCTGELQAQAQASTYPKWSSACLLRQVGLPTLRSAFMHPFDGSGGADARVLQFAQRYAFDAVMVRSDGGREGTSYVRGGNTLPAEAAAKLAASLLDSGRAVILVEPTRRFANRLTVNILLDRTGRMTLEILGPGYDTSDLNRGAVPAQYVVDVTLGRWPEHESLWTRDVQISRSEVDEPARRQMRLEHLASAILPNTAGGVVGGSAGDAERWLRERGYDHLWREFSYDFTLDRIQRWYDDVFLVAAALDRSRHWQAIVLSGSILADGRWIYWDVVDSTTKWARKAAAARGTVAPLAGAPPMQTGRASR